MSPRFAVLTLVLVAGLLTACAPEPAPTPTPTGFATEAEAFAAAEETYRAYVDALNEVDLSDPATFEPVFAWTTGELNSVDRRSLSEYHAEGYAVEGDYEVATVTLVSGTSKEGTFAISVCLDVSGTVLFDAAGNNAVRSDRPPRQPLVITLIPASSTKTQLAISTIQPSNGPSSC